ncbi:adenylate/guanylate cyclase domain-containing protein [Pokkaliibacter plantistimulans]|uniref:Adenylate/guanylate cyclase domain-containing protein n=1 Tax=Proteobacteria bacterium 228 TaxID=2083153 RepID=A0A2S5KM91_9PROT|nr:adenylate/guanylate cyclase domain-containing protein [Pokkaliibacter plantistimulans]PPC75944.1 adenylate/guanylate cyclase domain-containing protein [Pokkaliibacter plantistimulans]
MRLSGYWRKHYRQIIGGCLLMLLIAALQVAYVSSSTDSIAVLKRIDGILYDFRLKSTLRWRPHSSLPIVIVDIDERSLREQGRWPWNRDKVAQMLANLAQAGTAVVAFDILFAEPQNNPVQLVMTHVQDPQIRQQLAPLVEQLDADQALARHLQDTDTVLGILFQDDSNVIRGELPPAVLTTDNSSQPLAVGSFPGYLANIELLQQRAAGAGFINSTPDDDGFIRSAALLMAHQGILYPSLALEAARLYTLSDSFRVDTAGIGDYRSIIGVDVGGKRVPTDTFGRVLIPYRGAAYSYPYVSATDVVSGHLPAGVFSNAIVFVGTSAVGNADLRATPVGVLYPGVEVHANVFEGLLNPELLPVHPDWADGALLVLMLLVGSVLNALLPLLGPLAMAINGTLLMTAVVLINGYLWVVWRLDLPLTLSLSLIAVLTVFHMASGFFGEARQRRRIKSIFDQYVPPAHIERMLNHPEGLGMDGERREMTVLFSDIRGFTSISEKLGASELKSVLNRFFSPITKAIFEHQGTIDKYVGDMVMAFWNAPLEDRAHAEHAVETAFAMLKITDELQRVFELERLPAIDIGIGINTGDMNVGDMGSSYRRAYTVIGDAVNLGSRLEGLTKFYGVRVLVSEFTQAQCPDWAFMPVDRVKVKGKQLPVSIYEPLGRLAQLTEAQRYELSRFNQVLTHYFAQQWNAAESLLLELQHQTEHQSLYLLYLERVRTLRQAPPGVDWDGSYAHTSK